VGGEVTNRVRVKLTLNPKEVKGMMGDADGQEREKR